MGQARLQIRIRVYAHEAFPQESLEDLQADLRRDRFGHNKRDLAITQLAFYSDARGVLRVLAHLIEQGEYEELHETIRRHGRLIEKIQGRPLALGATSLLVQELPRFGALAWP